MTQRTIDVVLRKSTQGAWTSEGLGLPSATVVAVLDERGDGIHYRLEAAAIIVADRSPASLTARLQLSEDLVASSVLEQAKLELERQKVSGGERLARRTLIATVATALLSAGAAVCVAVIANSAAKPDRPQPAAYRDLDECYEGLATLKSLAVLDRQTLPDLQVAVRRQVDACSDRLKAAKAASAP